MESESYQKEIITSPFAIRDEARTVITDDSGNISQRGGIGVAHTHPSATNKVLFTRHDMNQIGCVSTLAKHWNMTGYMPTFEKEVSAKIGGYPKGTILAHYEPAKTYEYIDKAKTYTGWYLIRREVISLRDNNTKNFVKDAENSTPYKIGTLEDGYVWWRFVTRNKTVSYFPKLTQAVKEVEYGSYAGSSYLLYSSSGKRESSWKLDGSTKGIEYETPIICKDKNGAFEAKKIRTFPNQNTWAPNTLAVTPLLDYDDVCFNTRQLEQHTTVSALPSLANYYLETDYIVPR